MSAPDFQALSAEFSVLKSTCTVGRVVQINQNTVQVQGFASAARTGDVVKFHASDGSTPNGQVVSLSLQSASVMLEEPPNGLQIDDSCKLIGAKSLSPDASWIGRVIDPDGMPLDGRPLLRGDRARPLMSGPPPANERRALGARLETELNVFNTLLPIVRGQRVGLFSGSGVGKSTLLSQLAKGVTADVVVVALIGERGHELRSFVEQTLGEEGMNRAVVVAATSDQSALSRRQCAWSAMTIAEYFRDQGHHVLLLADSVTRFAEAHRDVAFASGEKAVHNGFPASMTQNVMSLAERAGPGRGDQGDITAIFTVLVAGSDMEGPVADTLRGVLDGHIILDRKIAERGRYPAIDVLKSVSRSLPLAASSDENKLIREARCQLGTYDASELMIQAGLYTKGTDPKLDAAIEVFPKLEDFIGNPERNTITDSFDLLSDCLKSRSDDTVPPVFLAEQSDSLA